MKRSLTLDIVFQQRLHITERTAEFHMSNVLGKLALPARAAAVAWVKDHAAEQWGV